MPNNPTATTSSRSSCFLGCFGFSGEKMQPNKPIDKVNSTTKRRRWVSNLSFGQKKNITTKVNADHNTVHRESKPLNVVVPPKPDTTWEIQVVEEDPALTKKHMIMVEQKTGRKKWTDIVKRQNGSFGSARSRRKETKPGATSVNGNGDESLGKKKVTVGQQKPLTHSKSLPVIKKPKVLKAKAASGGVDEGVVVDKTTVYGGGVRGEFDSMIAMLILLVILMVMVLWGKVCAIFCTCAWFFVAPRVVAVGERSTVVNTVEGRLPVLQKKLNFESEEYKKKVVLEGLLQRNHRNVVGRV